MSEIVIPTHDEIRATFEAVRHKIGCMSLCLDATIDDYPIGRRERGKCRLQVERAPGKGYRTVRTTTNKFGRWCAPKKSTYGDSLKVVVSNYDEEHQHAWLSVGNGRSWGSTGVWLTYANGEGIALAKCWRSDPPRRQDKHYTTETTKPISLTDIMNGAKPEPGEVREHVFKADPIEEIAAWDVWAAELVQVHRIVADTWTHCVVQS